MAKSKNKNDQSKKLEEIIVPVIIKNGKRTLLLSSYDDDWNFEAYKVDLKDPAKDVIGHKVEKVIGEGGVICTPKNDSIFDTDGIEFKFLKLPVIIIEGRKFIKLSHLTNTWNFTAKTIDKSEIEPKNYYSSGHAFGRAKGYKHVKCTTQKNIIDLKGLEL